MYTERILQFALRKTFFFRAWLLKAQLRHQLRFVRVYPIFLLLRISSSAEIDCEIKYILLRNMINFAIFFNII